jgi:Shedu protein SduA, C-terminal
LAATPSLLRGLLPIASLHCWCFDRPRLGAEFVPDFLLAQNLSGGFKWLMMELESPRHSALTAAGKMSGKMTDAVRQIGDWRSWLRENIAYAQRELGFERINAEIPAIILIGRRTGLDRRHAERYRELSMRDGLTVMTYDRLIESATALADRGR